MNKIKNKTIELTEEEMKEKDLMGFYDLLADKLGYTKDKENIQYDCRKLWISEPIQDHIFKHYYSQQYSVHELGALWLCCGPKTDKSLKGFTAIVQEGFIKEGLLCQQK